jgi:hypothetical protein
MHNAAQSPIVPGLITNSISHQTSVAAAESRTSCSFLEWPEYEAILFVIFGDLLVRA